MKNSIGSVFAFLDESSTLDGGSKFFCVAIVASNTGVIRNLQKIIRRIRGKTSNKKMKNLPELKFNNSNEKTRNQVLTELGEQNVHFLIFAVDKQGRRVENNPLNYGIVIGSTAVELLKIYPTASLTVDKHFTRPVQENEFRETVLNVVAKLAPSDSKLLLNKSADSQVEVGVQMADFVAGAVNACYNSKNSSYLEIIRTKIEKEICEKWVEIKRRAIKP